MAFQVIYLTGAPASGKSTLGRLLAERVQPLEVCHYSALLTDHLNRKHASTFVQDDLRAQSSKVVTAEDVNAVDDKLIMRVQEIRQHSHMLIDSHPVTKESYGFRVTPFTYEKLRALHPTVVCMLYAEAPEIARRIARESGGRPAVNEFQANFHIFLQSQVAVAYSMDLGLPLYVFDSTQSLEPAAEKLIGMMRR